MVKVILDTNFLMVVGQLRVDIFSELDRVCDFNYELYIIDKTIDELEKIIKTGKGKDKAAARLALDIISKKEIKKIKSKEDNVDDAIVNSNGVVATNDKELISRLECRRIIRLRAKRYLVISP